MESSIHSVPGGTGCIYSIRKSLFQPIPEETLLDDVFVPMNAVLQGCRNILDAEAIAYDSISKNFAEEKRRKVRTLLGNYQLLRIMPDLLSVRRNPICLAYISHKILRLFVPFFFLVLLFSSFAVDGVIYETTFVLLIVTLALALVHDFVSTVRYVNIVAIFARTFVVLNYFALLAFIYFIWPTKKNVW